MCGPFVKILFRQTFASYGSYCTLRVVKKPEAKFIGYYKLSYIIFKKVSQRNSKYNTSAQNPANFPVVVNKLMRSVYVLVMVYVYNVMEPLLCFTKSITSRI